MTLSWMLGGRLDMFEAKLAELPIVVDTVNLDFLRNVVGESRVAGGAVVSRTPEGSYSQMDSMRYL